MKRNILQPAQPIGKKVLAGVREGYPPREEPRSGWELERDPMPPLPGQLAAPIPAVERRRPLFRPRRGWFRRLERRAANFLAREVYPRIPGARIPYSRHLRRHLTLSETSVRLRGLPAEFEQMRILLITDIHAGPFVTPSALRETLRRLNDVKPDVILLGGDLTTNSLRDFRDHEQAFRELHAAGGVYAVLGNHDHYTGAPARLSEMIRECGIEVLQNRSVPLVRGGRTLWLAGVDDTLFGRPDLDAALAGTEGPVLLLSHNPDLFFEAQRRGVALTMSGHTHGGQIRIPRLGVLVRQSRYRLDEGRYRHGDSELIVSRGLGAVGLPVRIGCPAEAVLVRLETAPGGDGSHASRSD